MWRRCWAAILVLGAVTVPVSAQAKLEWKFKEGDKFYQETVFKSKQFWKMVDLGQEIKQDVEHINVNSFTVQKKNADGSVVIEQKFESVKINSTGIAAFAGNFLEKMQGTTLRFTLTPKNQITKLEGFDEVLKKIIGDDADPIIGKVVKQGLTKEIMMKQLEESFAFLPEKPVQKGDKWQRKSTIPLGPTGSFTAVQNYTHEGTTMIGDKKLDKIAFASNLTYTPPKPGEDAGGFFKVNKGDFKEASMKGTYYFDAQAGKLAQADMQMRTKGTLNISALGATSQIEMEQDDAAKIRVLDKSPAN